MLGKIINSTFTVEMLPTDFRFSPVSRPFSGSFPVPNPETGEVTQVPMNLIEIQYELLAGQWKKTIDGEATLIDFGSPVQVDSGRITIPNQLYLLIEQYLETPSPEMLVVINQQIAMFQFQNSLAGFVLQVSEISQ